MQLSIQKTSKEKAKERTSNLHMTFDLEEKITPERILNSYGTSSEQMLASDGIDRLKVDNVQITISKEVESQKDVVESTYKTFFPNAKFDKTEILNFDGDDKKRGGEKYVGISVSQPIEQ